MSARLHRFEAELLEAVSTGKPLAKVMDLTVRGIQALIPDSVASIHLLSADGLRLQPGAAPDLPASYVDALVDLPIGPTVGSCGTAAFRKGAVVVADIATDPLWADYCTLALAHGLAACWSTPVIDSEGKVCATFAIYHRQPHVPQPREIGLTAGAARILGIAIDKARRERVLSESDVRMRAIFEGAAIGMAIVNVEGLFVEANPAYCQMLGYAAQDLRGMPLRAITPEEDWPGNSAQVRNLIAGRDTGFVAIRRYVARGGGEVWARVSVSPMLGADGQVVALMGIAEDITSQKALERRERALAERLALTLETISDAFFTTSHDWRFTFGNRRLEEMFHLRREDFLGKTMAEVFAADVGGPFDPIFRAALRDKKPGRVEAFHSGLGLWLDVSAFPTDDGMAVYLRDISARKQAEAEIKELNAQLEARVQQRTEALTDANQALESFSYSVSHDLRAPLRTMSGFANLLEKEFGPALPEAGRRYVKRIHASAEKMGRLIDDLLLFSRQGRVALKPAVVDMHALAQEALGAAAADYPGHRVHTQLDALPSALCDANLIRQLWVNLVGNAFKFTARTKGATLHVGCDVRDGEQVYFVRDNGAGFDMVYGHKMFGVFERLHTESEFEGTGVGLAIVHQIVTRHGGRVWAQGQVDQGATFFFTLGMPG